MNILSETDKFSLEHEYETVYLKNKKTGENLVIDNFYGDPQCGLIDAGNQWAIITGDHLGIWTPERYERIEDENLQWICALRAKDMCIVELLVDPWSEKSSIWEINTNTFAYRKIRDFDNYRGLEYTEEIKW